MKYIASCQNGTKQNNQTFGLDLYSLLTKKKKNCPLPQFCLSVKTTCKISELYKKKQKKNKRKEINNNVSQEQGGILPGKVGKIFPGSIEISQEILMKNHALCHIFQNKLSINICGSNFQTGNSSSFKLDCT